jgi:Zn-dependent protease with chaperone function
MTLKPHLILTFTLVTLLAGLASAQMAAQAGPAPGQTAPAAAAPSSSKDGPAQAYTLPPDKLAKAIVLNKIRLTLEFAGTFWGLAVLWLLLSTRAAAGLERWAQRVSLRRWIQGVVFFAVFFVITTLADLPLSAIGHAVSLHYTISVQGWLSWFGDVAKGLGVNMAVGTMILLLFNWVVRVSPRGYWIWAWVITMPLIVAGVIAEPVVIDPLFNKFEPLSATHAALVGKLEMVVARTGTAIPPERMFLMKASKKTNGVNAYVTGLGSTKRFVMWDTLTDRMPDDEVLWVFGHESGHYVLNHIPKGIAISAVSIFIVFWACARFAEWMVRRFGPRWQIDSMASRAGFLTLLFALSIASFLLEPASNAVSRHFEHEADVYGQEAIHGIVADPQKTAVGALNDIGAAWLEDPDPSAFVEFWTYNHPSTKNRANFAAHYDPWANGGHGRFFDK